MPGTIRERQAPASTLSCARSQTLSCLCKKQDHHQLRKEQDQPGWIRTSIVQSDAELQQTGEVQERFTKLGGERGQKGYRQPHLSGNDPTWLASLPPPPTRPGSPARPEGPGTDPTCDLLAAVIDPCLDPCRLHVLILMP
jgi:hypothetical protein